MLSDRYELPLSTASSAARDAYVQGCEANLTMHPGAIEAFDRAIAADPGFALAHAARAHTLLERGEAAAAHASIAAARSLAAGLTAREASHPDGADGANPHGMSIKYHLPDGSETDMVINSLKFFLVATGEEFRDLFLAIAASPPNAPKPSKLDEFAAAHPSVPAALATIATPGSYADEQYNGVNAFVFVNKAGKRQAVRYQMVPTKLVHLSPADAAKRAPDFLASELTERLKHGPVTFHLKAQLAGTGDPARDSTKAWPSSRTVQDLGVLTITRAVPDSDSVQKTLLFLPTNLTDGIEESDDPLIELRGGSYAVSFSRRNP